MTISFKINTHDLIAPIGEHWRSYIDEIHHILTATSAIKLPAAFIKAVAVRVQRAARSIRSSVRQTFATRKAAKTSDDGGGSSDPDGRRPHTETNTSNTPLPVSAFLFGGAK